MAQAKTKHPDDCPVSWEYETDARYPGGLGPACTDQLLKIHWREFDLAAFLEDTRPVHGELFKGLTPPSCSYFAGHYRGENYKCLEHYTCGILGNPHVGAAPHLVPSQIRRFSAYAADILRKLDASASAPLTPADRAKGTVSVACSVFNMFLQIHPYANGNGHIARVLITGILARYGYELKRGLPVHPKPPKASPYSSAIAEYQHGNRLPLHEFVMWCILG